jgi:hypothetical protein
MEVNLVSGVGLSDLQHAARSEARRIIAESKGDNVKQMALVLKRLEGQGLITTKESSTLLRMYKVGHAAGAGQGDAHKAYFDARNQLATMLADSNSSPTALTIAAAHVGGFDIDTDGKGGTTITVYKINYSQHGAAIGAGIGALIGGPAGAVLGGEIGGLVGGIVDECTSDKGKGKGK